MENNNTEYDVIIIGGGLAGINCNFLYPLSWKKNDLD